MKIKGLVLASVLLSLVAVSCGKKDGGASPATDIVDPNQKVEGVWVNKTQFGNITIFVAAQLTDTQATHCGFSSYATTSQIVGPYDYTFADSIVTVKDKNGRTAKITYSESADTLTDPSGFVYSRISAEDLSLANKAGCNFH